MPVPWAPYGDAGVKGDPIGSSFLDSGAQTPRGVHDRVDGFGQRLDEQLHIASVL